MKIANPIGVLGEDIACDYLEKKGYKVIERNFRLGYTEIDIIALCNSKNHTEDSFENFTKHDSILVFIEVKARKSNAFGSPLESVVPWKLAHLVKTAYLYKSLHPNLPEDLRIDAIGIVLKENETVDKIEHLENISGF